MNQRTVNVTVGETLMLSIARIIRLRRADIASYDRENYSKCHLIIPTD